MTRPRPWLVVSILCATPAAQHVFVSVGITLRGHGPVVFAVDAREKTSALPGVLARSMCELAALDDAACDQLVGVAPTLAYNLAERRYVAAAGGLAAHDVRVEYTANDEACEVSERGRCAARARRATRSGLANGSRADAHRPRARQLVLDVNHRVGEVVDQLCTRHWDGGASAGCAELLRLSTEAVETYRLAEL